LLSLYYILNSFDFYKFAYVIYINSFSGIVPVLVCKEISQTVHKVDHSSLSGLSAVAHVGGPVDFNQLDCHIRGNHQIESQHFECVGSVYEIYSVAIQRDFYNFLNLLVNVFDSLCMFRTQQCYQVLLAHHAALVCVVYEFLGILLHVVVGQVHKFIVAVDLVVFASEAQVVVRVVLGGHRGGGFSEHYPDPDVEFPAVLEQTIFNILLGYLVINVHKIQHVVQIVVHLYAYPFTFVPRLQYPLILSNVQ